MKILKPVSFGFLGSLLACASLHAVALNFDSYTTGALSGQDGWVVDATETAKTTITAGGLFGNTEGNYLATAGTASPSAKMNKWVYRPVTLTGTTYVSFQMNFAASGNTDPSELFIGFNNTATTSSAPWNTYVAVKHPNNGSPAGLESTGPAAPANFTANSSIVLNTDLFVVIKFQANASNLLESVQAWVNPAFGDEGSPALVNTIAAPATDLTLQNLLKFRVQNAPSKLDNVNIGSTWADVVPVPEPATYAWTFGLLAAVGALLRRRA